MEMRKAAIYTGVSILTMAIAAGIAFGFVHSELFVEGNPELTFNNLNEKNNLIPFSVIGWLTIIITDFTVSWALFQFLKPFNNKKARIVGELRLVYTLILTIAVGQLFMSYFQNNAQQAYDLMESFQTTWNFGLIVFGAHLYYLGKTACYQNALPKWMNGLLVLGGIGYVLVSAGKVWFENHEWVTIAENILILPMAISELSMAIWLLVKGGKVTSKVVAS